MINTKIILKNKIFFISIIILVVLIHTILISKGHTFFLYERLRDFFISLISSYLIVYSLKGLNEKKDSKKYLIMANFFVLIFVIHLLRLIFGGLKC